jgi:hypothetical protein
MENNTIQKPVNQKLGKLYEKRKQFEAALEEKQRMSAEAIKKAEDEIANFKLSEDDQAELDKLAAKGVSIRTDAGTEVLDMIDSLSESFSPAKLSEPILALFAKSDDDAADQFEMMFGEFYDQDEVSRDEIITLLHDTWNTICEKFNVERSEGIDERLLTKLTNNNILFDLDERLVKLMTGTTTRMMSADKYKRITKDLVSALSYIALKDSLDVFIENETVEMEIYSHVERYLAEMKIAISKGEYIDPEKMFMEIKEILKEEGIVNFSDATITFIFEKKKSNLLAFADLLSNNNHADEKVREAITKRANKYIEHAAMLDRILKYDFINPYLSYSEHLRSFKNENSIKKNKSMEADLVNYLGKLRKYTFSVPFPGYKKTDKDFRDLMLSMSQFFTEALTNYNEKKLEGFPEVRDISGIKGFSKDDVGFIFSMYVLNILMRFDKKFMKHVDFKEDKDKLIEYVSAYQFICGASDDILLMRKLVQVFNETMEGFM